MSLATASNGPEAKKFRFDLPTQVVVNEFNYGKKNNVKMEIKSDCEASSDCNGVELGLDLRANDKLSPTNSTANGYKCEALSPSPSLSQDSSTTDTHSTHNNNNSHNGNNFNVPNNPNFEFPFAMLFQQASAIMNSVSKEELKAAILAQSRGPAPVVPPTPPAPIPGALAVAASPAAQLFSEDDWSWHRNPAAAIRSGGTNKQTPVWKYFVYNKAENLSRCIIGDCTYMLKGPHTSTLACHLKKHPVEYAEFQKLKLKFQQEYTRERNAGQLNGSVKTSQPSSAENSARHTPTPTMGNSMGVFKKADTPTSSSSIFSGSKSPLFGGQKSQSKQSSVTDILNILSARANANATPIARQPEESMNHVKEENGSPVTPVPPMHPFSHMMGNQKNNAFLLNFIKQHNVNVMNTLNNNTNSANNNNISNNNNHLMMPNRNNNNPAKYQPPQLPQQQQQQQQPQIQPQKPPKQAAENERKWLKQDKKQKEMEVKLGLALAAAQLPVNLINNPFFRDFVETAQPRFTMPLESNQIEELVNHQYAMTLQAIKMQLATAPKISLIIDVLKLGQKQWEADENTEYSAASSKNSDKGPVVRLCISASYYSSLSQSMDVVLLGIRQPVSQTAVDEGIRDCVDQLLSEYDLSWDRISRVVATGLEEIGASERPFDRQLEPYNQKLTLSLINVFDTDAIVVQLKKLFYNMVYCFAENPEIVAHLMKEIGKANPIPLGEPFIVLAEFVLKIKDCFVRVCNSEQFFGSVPLLSEEQWLQLEAVVNLLSLFKAHMRVVQDGHYATIDRVVPSLMQLKVCLERDYSVLKELPHKLLADLYSRTQYILDSNSDSFDGSFIQATALNPQLALLLDDAQMCYAKNAIEKVLTERMKQAEEFASKKLKGSCGVDALLAAVVERKHSTASSPPLSPASSTTSESNPLVATTLYPDLLQAANQRRKVLNDRQQNGKNLFAEAIVQNYFDYLLKSDSSLHNGLSSGPGSLTNIHPLQYWQRCMPRCQQLSEIAIELLSVPSCTVSIERIFCHENMLQNVQSSLGSYLLRSTENPSRVERDSILRFNRNFIPKNNI